LKVTRSSQFKKDYKLAKKQHKNITLLIDVINRLSQKEKRPDNLQDHKLSGRMKDYRELHLAPDWLLIYKVNSDENELKLARLGSHAQLFRK
jgi:mRNA interferase YafQ